MLNSLKSYISRRIFPSTVKEREVVEAYDLWAENYDAQPGNLMLDLDEFVFSKLLKGIDLKNKNVADIGCGTGRHWKKLMEKTPGKLTGFDVSPGMLNKLKEKFPSTETHIITDDSFLGIKDGSFDVIVSTLTMAHIGDIEQALGSWSRILKHDGDIIITDFHPDILAFGGKRTFKHQNAQIAVRNHIHTVSAIKKILLRNDFKVVAEEEKYVDETVKHYYTAQNAARVYQKFKGFPVIYGMHFRRA